MTKYNKLSNQLGFSLVSVLVALGLTGVLAVIIMRLGENQSKSTQASLSSSEFLTVSNHLQSKFLKSSYCEDSLKGKSIAVNSKLEISNLVGRNVNGTTSIEYATAQSRKFQGLKISKFELVRDSSNLFLDVYFERTNKNSYGGKDLKKRIYINPNYETDNKKIKSCYSDLDNMVETARQKSCEDTGFFYDKDHVPACYPKFIRDMIVVTGSTANCPSGYQPIHNDLNKGAGGDYIYFCVTSFLTTVNTTQSFDPPLSHLTIVWGGGNTNCPSGYEKDGTDLNKGAGGKFIYLCKRRAVSTTQRVSRVAVASGGGGASCPAGFTKNTTDLNKGAHGDFIYLCYQKENDQ